jgi:hypothetical protein
VKSGGCIKAIKMPSPSACEVVVLPSGAILVQRGAIRRCDWPPQRQLARLRRHGGDASNFCRRRYVHGLRERLRRLLLTLVRITCFHRLQVFLSRTAVPAPPQRGAAILLSNLIANLIAHNQNRAGGAGGGQPGPGAALRYLYTSDRA